MTRSLYLRDNRAQKARIHIYRIEYPRGYISVPNLVLDLRIGRHSGLIRRVVGGRKFPIDLPYGFAHDLSLTIQFPTILDLPINRGAFPRGAAEKIISLTLIHGLFSSRL